MLEFQEIYTPDVNALLKRFQPEIHAILDDVSKAFYDELLKDPQARKFLDEQEVRHRLVHSQKAWLKTVLTPHAPEEKDCFIEKQVKVGQVHARINLPINLMMLGVRLHKRHFFKLLLKSQAADEDRLNLFLAITDILDYTAMLINDAYMKYEQILEQETQAFTLTYSSTDLALEILTVKSDIQQWLIELLSKTENKACENHLSTLEEMDFWLWMEHKLAQMQGHFRSISLILAAQESLKHFIETTTCCAGDKDLFIAELKKHISRITHSLKLLSDEVVEENHNLDPLTRLLNRRLLDGLLQKEHQIARSHGGDYAIMMIDVDNFKQLNDTYGHAVGDAALKQVASIIRENLRITDLAFRYGGEEFLVLLPLPKGGDPTAIGEKLRKAVENCEEFSPEHKDLRVTVSIGISQYSLHPHPDYIHVLRQADRALYEAKKAGRNRVVLYSGELI